MTYTSAITSYSPQIASLPPEAEARLLDLGMLHYEASLAGSAERYGRGETSHTIHVWWARRPHSSMRALVFASLCKDLSLEATALLKELGQTPLVPNHILMKARQTIREGYRYPPRLLDMFAGGGTIPAEACNLGAETYSLDSNQLSVFIQQCNLVYSQGHSSAEISQIVKASGTKILTQLAKDTSVLFPLREELFSGQGRQSPVVYLWSYSMKCTSCGYRFYLSKRPWLSRKKGKRLAFVVKDGKSRQSIRLCAVEDGYRNNSVWIGNNGTVECPKCKTRHSGIDIRNCKDEMVAVVRLSDKVGKQFSSSKRNAILSLGKLRKLELSVLKELQISLPRTQLPKWSGIVNPSLYGIQSHADFLNNRQRIVLLLLVKQLKSEYQRLHVEYGEAIARFVICLLSSFIDQMVDWNSRLSMWIPQNEQIGRAFCGPGISMLWDYAETDPLLSGPANLWGKLRRIVAGSNSILQYPYIANVQHGYAQELRFPNDYFDAIVTDPPYYDNIYYNILADFFYSWKRLLLESIDPTLFSSPETDSQHELVASKFRSGTHEKAHADYCEQLKLALNEAERVLKPDGIFSFLYSHSSLKGWEAIIKGYRATKFVITSIQPLSIERRQRPRAMSSKAVNTCITFVAHKSNTEKPRVKLDEIKSHLVEICETFMPSLQRAGWKEADAALAVFANGVGMLANAEAVYGCDSDIEALRSLESVVNEKIPSFCLQDRNSL